MQDLTGRGPRTATPSRTRSISHRRGNGAALLAQLIDACTRRGDRQMIAVIGDSANAPSIALHARAGFVEAGRLANVGHKFERWLDIVLMQRALGEGAATAPAARPIR